MPNRILADFDLEKIHNEVVAAVNITFEQLGVPELKEKTIINWNHKFVRKAGQATYYNYKNRGEIELGVKYYSIASEEGRLNTAIHEACHVVDKYIHGFYDSKDGHGPNWFKLMRKMGIQNPSITHSVDMSVFKNFYFYNCATCGKRWKFTAQRGGRMLNGTTYYNCVCKTMINPSRLIKVSGADLLGV